MYVSVIVITVISCLITLNSVKGSKDITYIETMDNIDDYTATIIEEETEIEIESATVTLVEVSPTPYEIDMMTLNNSNLSPKDYLIAYKQIMTKYSINYTSIYDVYSAEEIYLMQRCVQTETNQCGDFMGRCNVASVLINRLNSGLFGETMTEIITNDGQFAYWRTGIEEDTKLALEYIFIFGDTTNNCIGFHSFKTYKQVWNGWNYSFTDNIGHHFFKLN